LQSNSHLHVAQWLYEINPLIDISSYNNYAFRFSCQYGRACNALELQSNSHLHIAQWLFEIKPGISNISSYNVAAFRYACQHGDLPAAQLLLEMNPTINIEYAFRYVCANGRA
jgi:hypothetical protein